ncbi:MAG: hypothetical protein KIT84_42230 [Labilithrix sp.]|nr:hypothetical protein [Labilithrix sp.]MCW5817694.1 hypothetical protein [Labilithrix sp.]
MRSTSVLLAISIVACGGGSTGTGTPSGDGSTSGSASSSSTSSSSGEPGGCGAQAIAPNLTGGCAPRIVTPALCEEVDLTGGKTYELAWTTDGTGCETPWKLCAAGNPVSDPNSICVNLSTDVNAGISRTGGILVISAADLEGLTSDTGVHHLLVASFHESHAGSVAFRVKR